jgi:DNA-binding PadR family transcriptional regulator
LGRFFAHGDLRLVVLSMIAEKPRYGYEIIKEIEDRVGGAYTPSPGVIYPTLTLLEELGQVTVSDGDGGKKLHTIKKAGLQYLDAHKAELEPILVRIGEAKKNAAGREAAPLVRSMENLKLALRLRLDRGPLTDEQIRAIAAALDAAATTVEGL